jgi:flagellar motility protein MotE (MotC chaperone)
MMFAAVIMLGVRVGDVWDAMIAGPAGLALVEPSPAWADGEEPAPADDQAEPAPAEPETMDVAVAEDAAAAHPEDAENAERAGPGSLSLEPEEMTPGELELLQNLSERREALEEREQALSERAALLTVAERRIDEKMAELTALRAQLEGMMGMVDEEQEARLARLVSMYEAMRPTDAADIFNGLDMDVLIDVLQRMREQKSAPILAAMEPERARMVTAELVMRRELPELPTE